jgi:BirA family biotin operon repressor/biotin-[acetyl-CoA-carboxylase] ligase
MQIPVWRETLPEIDSTNTYCLTALRNKQPVNLPWLVVGEKQTAGRGRGENRWFAGDGALTFSLVISPADFDLKSDTLGLLSLSTGVAICEALESFYGQLSLKVKWPNDVYLNAKKLAGILIESAHGPEGPLVIGVGINTHNSLLNAPADVQQRAISLGDVLTDLDLNDTLVDTITQRMLQSYLALGQSPAETSESLRDRFQSRSYLDRLDVTITTGETIHQGICIGIDTRGGLILQTPAGTKTHYAGTVRLTSE